MVIPRNGMIRFPREKDTSSGWTIDFEFVKQIHEATIKGGYPMGYEEIEQVLMEVERLSEE